MPTSQAPTNPVNEAHKSYSQNSNQFPAMSYRHYTTEIFGLLNPFFAMEGVEGDVIPLNSNETVLTHTLSSLLMSKIDKRRDYYNIPMRAIMPRTWELIYTNPTQGDDIPEDANCCFPLKDFLNQEIYQLGLISSPDSAYSELPLTLSRVGSIIRNVLVWEMFFSDGSLLAKSGYRLNSFFNYYRQSELAGETVIHNTLSRASFDNWFEEVFVPWFQTQNITFTIEDKTYALAKYKIQDDEQVLDIYVTAQNYVDVRTLLMLLRDHIDFKVTEYNTLALGNQYAKDLFVPGSIEILPIDDSIGFNYVDAPTINLSRLIAYQLITWHFYSNDKIDHIYSAQLYRGMMQSYLGLVARADANNDNAPTAAQINSLRAYFNYNGELLEYDTFSEKVFKTIFLTYYQGTAGTESNNYFYGDNAADRYSHWCSYLRNIFGLNRSLRYGDYFVGSRPSPLAVGDVNANVNIDNRTVNALDMTKSLLMQRFLNAVNRTGRKFSNYIQMLSGKTPAPLVDDPKWLGSFSSTLGKQVIENTGENQGNLVTLLRGGDDHHAFTFECSEPCVLIGVSWYEVQRIYSKSIDRFAFHRTRFDMFNKFFQYEGDQAIFARELDNYFLSGNKFEDNFGYTMRHMEYKQRLPIATGGFVNFLKSYLFVTDNHTTDLDAQKQTPRISPDFIRAQPTEFDRFYERLTNCSLAGYFHFIVAYDNATTPSREMDFAPSVL